MPDVTQGFLKWPSSYSQNLIEITEIYTGKQSLTVAELAWLNTSGQ